MALGEVKILELDSTSSFSTSVLSTDGGYEEDEDIDRLSNEEIERLLSETL